MTININRTGALTSKNVADTVELVFDAKQVTKLDHSKALTVQQENKYISDAGVLCYAKWFGFRDETLTEKDLTNELRSVVSYAFRTMRTQEDKKAEEKSKIPYPTWWQSKLADKPRWIRVALGADTKYFDTPKDSFDHNKRIGRLLREGLEIDQNTANEEVYKTILKRI